ncbi:MAG: hypothetical protein R3B82_27735 [Sandaracinaceae bacterium]
MTEALGTFFGAMRAALAGEIDATEIEARCGPSSATDRLDLVLRMVHAGRRRLLDGVYAATRVACDREGDDVFERAVRAHLEGEAGAQKDYATIALGLPAMLEAVGAPAFALEVADWEESLHRLRVVGAPAPRGRLRGPVITRAYTADVPAWARRAREDGAVPLPTPASTLVVLHRDDEARVRWLHPTAALLGALAEAAGDATADDLHAAGLTERALEEARADLRRRGLLEDA